MATLTDNDIMPFGKWKKRNTKMANVPAGYLIWLNENGSRSIRSGFPEVFEYIKDNMDVLMEQHDKKE